MATKAQKQYLMLRDVKSFLSGFCTSAATFMHDFELQTQFGLLTIGLSADRMVRGEEPTITLFCRFQDATAARAAGFDCNKFSGKWNHHFLQQGQSLTTVLRSIQDLACGHSDTKVSISKEPSTASESV
jgi:hypothetical protein